jgi:hypothetical protein
VTLSKAQRRDLERLFVGPFREGRLVIFPLTPSPSERDTRWRRRLPALQRLGLITLVDCRWCRAKHCWLMPCAEAALQRELALPTLLEAV